MFAKFIRLEERSCPFAEVPGTFGIGDGKESPVAPRSAFGFINPIGYPLVSVLYIQEPAAGALCRMLSEVVCASAFYARNLEASIWA